MPRRFISVHSCEIVDIFYCSCVKRMKNVTVDDVEGTFFLTITKKLLF